MSKGKSPKKSDKKKPAMTAKEKKVAKRLKKSGAVTGFNIKDKEA